MHIRISTTMLPTPKVGAQLWLSQLEINLGTGVCCIVTPTDYFETQTESLSNAMDIAKQIKLDNYIHHSDKYTTHFYTE